MAADYMVGHSLNYPAIPAHQNRLVMKKKIQSLLLPKCDMYHPNLMGDSRLRCYNCEYIRAWNDAIHKVLNIKAVLRQKLIEGTVKPKNPAQRNIVKKFS